MGKKGNKNEFSSLAAWFVCLFVCLLGHESQKC